MSDSAVGASTGANRHLLNRLQLHFPMNPSHWTSNAWSYLRAAQRTWRIFQKLWGCGDDTVMIFACMKWSKQLCSTHHPLEWITGPHVWTIKLFPSVSALSECMHNAQVLSLLLINWRGNYIDAAVRPDASELSPESHAGKLSPTNMERVIESLTRAASGLKCTWHSEESVENCNVTLSDSAYIASKREQEKGNNNRKSLCNKIT